MLFSSLEFLLRFLPATLLLYYLAPRRFKNPLLVVAGLFFYAWGEPTYVVLILLSCIVNYGLGIAIENNRGNARGRAALLSAVVLSLGLLGFFKYSDLLIATFNNVFGSTLALLNLPLPIGISFYTFRILSYIVDVYRNQASAQRNLLSFTLYVSLFPELLAGPIERYKGIAAEIDDRKHSIVLFAEGVHRFVTGLGKKVLIANNIALLLESCRTTANPSVLSSWMGIVAFAFQIYFDFSGYSDMAIGLGRMFGFHFMENFNFPYVAQSITDFWRRWHMSLTQWFRDYLYIPLGGNRVPKLKWVRNILVVWFLTGLWHGANWNFAFWGTYFGALLVLEKLLIGRYLQRLPRFVRHVYTLLIVLVGWVFFELTSVPDILAYLGNMVGLGGIAAVNHEAVYLLQSNAVLLALAFLGSTPLCTAIYDRWSEKVAVRAVFMPVFYLAVLIASVAYVVDSSFSPFLYFRF